MTTRQEIDRQTQLWSLGIGLAGAALLLAAAAASASKRSRAARGGVGKLEADAGSSRPQRSMPTRSGDRQAG